MEVYLKDGSIFCEEDTVQDLSNGLISVGGRRFVKDLLIAKIRRNGGVFSFDGVVGCQVKKKPVKARKKRARRIAVQPKKQRPAKYKPSTKVRKPRKDCQRKGFSIESVDSAGISTFHISISACARVTGVPKSTISKILKGERRQREFVTIRLLSNVTT